MKRLGGNLAFVAVFLCALCAYANGTFRGNGLFYAPGGGGGGGVSPSSDLSLNVGSKLILDADADGNNYIVGTDTSLAVYVEGALIDNHLFAGTYYSTRRILLDDKYFAWGTGEDAWIEWDTATTPDQLSLNNTDCDGGGTDCVIWYTEAGSPNLFLKNGEFIHNDTNGKITLGGSGGTNNEDLIIDLESVANRVTFSSSTGAARWDFTQSGSTLYGYTVSSVTGFTAGASFDMKWDGRLRIYSPADGQLRGTNAGLTLGATLDFAAAAGTVVIKDQAGTGDGNLNVTGGRKIGTRVIDVDDSPYTVVSTDEVIIVDTDSGTGAPAAVTVNLPAAACGITIGGTEKSSCRIIRVKNIGGTSNVTVDANASEEIDAATTQTVTPGGNLTLIDANQTNYHWVIQ